MSSITIPLPTLRHGQHVEIEVTIDGRQQHFSYRVEAMALETSPAADRIEQLRTYISEHEPEWQLVQIGVPMNRILPVMFRKRSSPRPAS